MVATQNSATALVKTKSGPGFLPGAAARSAALACARRRRVPFALLLLLALITAGEPASAASNKVRISKLVDIAFGTIANLGADAVRSESVCLFADTSTNGYNVTATGTGTGGAFELSGPGRMAYDVQWSNSSGQSSGTQLVPNVPLTGQVSSATQQTCGTGPATSASLVVILRAAALSSAGAGAYSGTLTVLIGPE